MIEGDVINKPAKEVLLRAGSRGVVIYCHVRPNAALPDCCIALDCFATLSLDRLLLYSASRVTLGFLDHNQNIPPA